MNHASVSAFLDALKTNGEIDYKCDYLLSKASSFHIGGTADFVVFPLTYAAMETLLKYCRDNGIYYTVVGNGSNILFSDAGFRGIIIITSKLNDISAEGCLIKAGCGVPLSVVANVALKCGLGGAEFTYGIPGTVGGAVFMNAGAYEREIKDIVESVTWFDPDTGKFGEYDNVQNNFSYRESIYQHCNKIILSVLLKLDKRNPELIKQDMDDYMRRRCEKQPLEFPSGGSTFKRYPGYFTGKLIEEAGLKGYTVGGAQVSEKHAGFVINKGGATAGDVLSLIDYVKKRVLELNGINIECEIRFIPETNNR